MVQIIGSVAVGLAVASAAVAAPSSSSSAAVPRGADAGSSCPRRDAVNSFIGTGGLGYGYGVCKLADIYCNIFLHISLLHSFTYSYTIFIYICMYSP